MKLKPERLKAIRDQITERASRLPDDLQVPADPVLSMVLDDVLTQTGDRVRIISKTRGNATREGRFLHTHLRWHASGGSLWSIMGAQWLVRDASMRDRLETLALVLRGGSSTACDAWSRALGL